MRARLVRLRAAGGCTPRLADVRGTTCPDGTRCSGSDCGSALVQLARRAVVCAGATTEELLAAGATAEELLRADRERAAAEAARPLPDGSRWRDFGGAELEPHLAHTTVVDAAWLLKLALGEVPEHKGVVPAWQDVPSDACVSLEQ